MSPEMQHEIDLIGEQLMNENKVKYDPFTKSVVPAQPQKYIPKVKLIIPTLGSIFENQIDELPSPDMVPIEIDTDDEDVVIKKTPLRKEYSTT